jgi:hypothetical protein
MTEKMCGRGIEADHQERIINLHAKQAPGTAPVPLPPETGLWQFVEDAHDPWHGLNQEPQERNPSHQSSRDKMGIRSK